MISVLEILKNKLIGLKYILKVCWENSLKNEKLTKRSCLNINIDITENFIKENESTIEDIIKYNKKNKVIFTEDKQEDIEKRCLENIHLFLIK